MYAVTIFCMHPFDYYTCFVYLYHSLMASILHVISIYLVIFSTQLLLLKTFVTLSGLLCADVPLRNYSLTLSGVSSLCFYFCVGHILHLYADKYAVYS